MERSSCKSKGSTKEKNQQKEIKKVVQNMLLSHLFTGARVYANCGVLVDCVCFVCGC